MHVQVFIVIHSFKHNLNTFVPVRIRLCFYWFQADKLDHQMRPDCAWLATWLWQKSRKVSLLSEWKLATQQIFLSSRLGSQSQGEVDAPRLGGWPYAKGTPQISRPADSEVSEVSLLASAVTACGRLYFTCALRPRRRWRRRSPRSARIAWRSIYIYIYIYIYTTI